MSETPVLGSLNKTLAEKKLAKYDPALEKKVRTSLAILVPEVNLDLKIMIKTIYNVIIRKA
jgi:hypothetical protein